MVPHVDPEGVRPYLPPVLALVRHTGTEVGMVADRRGLHRATKLASTLPHWHEPCRLPRVPAPCGHHRNPLEGFWRVLQDRSGAGRWFPDLPQLSHRTRRVLMAQHERPIYAFHWERIPPHTLRELLAHAGCCLARHRCCVAKPRRHN